MTSPPAARAASGHASAAPSIEMNSRRRIIRSPRRYGPAACPERSADDEIGRPLPRSQGRDEVIRAISKQKQQDYLNWYNTGAPFHWLTAMTTVLVSLITATVVLGAWTLAILKAKRQARGATAIHRRLPEVKT
jgi:hypothetical protein